ncbi:MAG: prolipoprotein diacylglyceryl transferase, partial [Anaerolineae bacterium]|nr:prolipoprotein diacylglyceryl transferase [Anaerolineae bacterium]
IYGGLVGGIFAVWLYTQVLVRLEWKGLRAKRIHPPLNLLRWFDIAAPGVLLAQAIGRFGNFVNQELYGPPTTLPWGFKINPNYPYQPPPPGIDIATTRFHPTFFYESAWCLTMFLVLLYVARRFAPKLKDGDVFLGYFIAYPLGRLWVEAFRPDAWKMGALATAQWISIISVVLATAALIIRHRPGTPRAAVTVGESLPPQPPQEMTAETPEPSPSDTQPTGT